MNFVLDASIALSWCFEDEGDDYAERVLESLNGSEATTASLWPLEMANGLLTAERRGRIEPAASSEFMHLLLSLPIVIDPVARRRSLESAVELGRRHGLTSYDAAYLELALRLEVPLATLDEALADAARREGVELFLST
jgi:predicted nucleic acid-binding protein